MRSLLFFAIAAPIAVSAQTVHKVMVGDSTGALKFTPEAISAQQGDIVTFEFHQKNHSVVQSTLQTPCGQKDGGFNSNFFPVAPDVTSDFPQWNLTVPDMNPIWVHCGQTNPVSHCGSGMVFAVNCGADGAPNSFANFKAAALATASSTTSSGPYGAPAPAPAAASPPATDSSAPSPAPAPSNGNAPTDTIATGTSNVIDVRVGGNNTLTFDPPTVSAAVGTTIRFTFTSKNHTLTQSSFGTPCVHAVNATTGQSGFDSGFMFVANGTTDFPTYSILINDTTPVWAYCKQRSPIDHCGQGMVFAVNTNESSNKSYAAFVALAKAQNGTQSTNGTDTGAPAPGTGAAVQTSAMSALTLLSLVGVMMLV